MLSAPEAAELVESRLGASVSGTDSDNRAYSSLSELYDVLSEDKRQTHNLHYYAVQPTDDDGVLGGQSHISAADLAESDTFLASLRLPSNAYALDVAAGVGRVTEGLLQNRFHHVFLLEQSEAFLNEARRRLEGAACQFTFLQQTMESFSFSDIPLLDCVWLQWCCGCVHVGTLISFLKAAAQHLQPGGAIIVKENVCRQDPGFWMDTEDCNLVVSRQVFLTIFDLAGLHVVAEDTQREWDPALMQVRIWALQPDAFSADESASEATAGGATGPLNDPREAEVAEAATAEAAATGAGPAECGTR